MKSTLLSGVIAAALSLAPIAFAQTGAQTGAPGAATVTATCKDGTQFTGTSRSGACAGHKGVASWGAAAASQATPSATPPATPGQTEAGASGGSTAKTGGKTGGPGQVWVNSATKVYHCPGDRYYGKTKSGEFMSQSAAVAAGAHPSGGKACQS
jgi:hypothetical protein